MTERGDWRHGLESGLERLKTRAGEGKARLNVQIMASLGHLNLRGDPENAAFVEALGGVLRQPLPTEPNTVSNGARRIFWLGPDEWLLTTSRDGLPALSAEVESALRGVHAAVNDVSAGQVLLALRGAIAAEVLAAGCTLDLRPEAFPRGRCAQTGLAKAGVLLSPGENGGFDVVVRRSYADYLLTWIAAVAGESDVAVSVG